MAKQCPSCATPNRDDARFCSNCATPLVSEIPCPSCGTANQPKARFCRYCATPLRGMTPQTGMLQPNAVLAERYIIVRKVGGGGMGAVYQATDQRIQGKLWAIKEMSDAAITNPLDKQRAIDAFRREAQLLAILDHGNLPKVSDYFTEGGKHYLVMDFVQGHTLEQVLHSAAGFLAEDEVATWAIQICDVLAYLHSRQPAVIFRDLKPTNIMLDVEGRIKLIDFGIARLFQPGKGKDTQIMGTPGYAAPEQYGTGQTDARSDIYALGVTLHQLLTRYDPSLSPFNLPPARNINLRLSPVVEAVIVKATQTDVTARFQTVEEVKQALAKRGLTPEVKRGAFEPEMIRIPTGEFLMGSKKQDKVAYNDEKPQHRVYLAEYWIGKYPVTNAQYTAFVDATGHEPPEHWKKARPPKGKENHPVACVSWYDAAAYCHWLAKEAGKPYRLLTEAEWEKAARGTDGRTYPWGEGIDCDHAQYCECGGQTVPVGSKPKGASPYGALDMAGNVWEWVADWYDSNYYSHFPSQNPQGPDLGKHKVIRGGSWFNGSYDVRSATRIGTDPDSWHINEGFRCARSAK